MWLDDGWAILDGQAARFDPDVGRYVRKLSRGSDSFANILRLSRVTGGGWLAWAIGEGKPYREVRPRRAVKRPYTGEDPSSAVLHWTWELIPSVTGLAEIVAAPGDANGRVWALGTNGTPYQWSDSFTARPASFPFASLCVSDSTEAFALSRSGQVYRWEGSAWAAFLCFERRSGEKVPLVARQMRALGRFGRFHTRHLLLTATGKLYLAEGAVVVT